MAKKITEKIVTKHNFKVEGFLDTDNLNEDMVKLEVEEEGVIDIFRWLKSFNGKYVKITIEETSEEVPEI